jgi:hypothetical protein
MALYVVYVKTLPILFFILLGWTAKWFGLLSKRHGHSLVWIVFNITLPATIFLALLSIKLSVKLVLLPISAMSVVLSMYPAARIVLRELELSRESSGTFIISTMIINMGFFAYPVIKLYYGSEGLARAAFFDLGHVFLVFTVVYFIAARHGREDYTTREALASFLLFPPIWALGLAIPINAFQIEIPNILSVVLQILDSFTIPLVMITLGVFLDPHLQGKGPILSVIGLRMGFGFLLGIVFSKFFGLDGLDRQVVILSSMMPIGVNSMVFSARENLDVEFAARAVSLSILIGFLLVPLVIAML